MFASKGANNQVQPMQLEDLESSAVEQATENLADNNDENRRKESSSALRKKPESLATFLENTSLHGARFLVEGRVFRRLFWLCAMCVSLAYCLIQLQLSIRHYLGAPFVTQITMKEDFDAPFPAITLCNFNPINKRNLEQIENVTDQGMAKSMSQIQSFRRDPSKFGHAMEELMVELMLNANETFGDMNRRLGHQIKDILLPDHLGSCTLNGVRCNASNFTSFLNFQYGQCHTINSGKAGPVIPSSKAGAQNGLKLLLNVERDSYAVSARNPMVGFKVLVHHQSIFPGSATDVLGFAVEPGKHAFCSIRKKEIINLGTPHETNCSERRLNLFDHERNYTKEACIMECEYRTAIDKCKCQPVRILGDEYPICTTKDTIYCFIPSAVEASSRESCRKNCPEPCHYVKYESQVTNAALLEDGIAKELLESLKKQGSHSSAGVYKKLLNGRTAAERNEYVRRNIVYLTIYFEELRYERIQQVSSFDISELLVALGGNLGLFLGVSELTVLEFVDYVVRRLLYFVFGKFKRPSQP